MEKNYVLLPNGKTTEVKALEGLEEVEFEDFGKLEGFFTDSVRTLHHTTKANNNMWEKTLRYPGHVEKVKLMKELGLLNKKSLKSMNISPWKFMCKFWEENLSFFEDEDVLLMRIIVSGKKNSEKILHTYEVVDYYDKQRKITAMGRSTAYTAFAVIKLIMENKINKKGIISPEILGMHKSLFQEIQLTLKERNLEINEKVENEPILPC